MKKGFYIALAVFLVVAFVLNLKKKEIPGAVKTQEVKTTAHSSFDFDQDIFNKIPDKIKFCSDEITLTVDQKINLAKALKKESKSFSNESLRNSRNNMWFSYIRKELKKKNLHEDLKYVPVIESRLNPLAESNKGAMGPWQLTRATAEGQGLTVIPGIYDERRDFVSSTEAALNHLTELHNSFRNWIAVLAAYNAGEKGISQAMKKEKINNFFFLVKIWPETKEFPYRAIANKLIFENPEQYGFTKEKWLADDYYDKNNCVIIKTELLIETDTTIEEIVEIIKADDHPELTVADFKRFNPQIIVDQVPRGNYYKAYILKPGCRTS